MVDAVYLNRLTLYTREVKVIFSRPHGQCIARSLSLLMPVLALQAFQDLISTAIQPSFQGSVRFSSKGMPFALASLPESNRLPQVSSKRSSLPSANARLCRADARASVSASFHPQRQQ